MADDRAHMMLFCFGVALGGLMSFFLSPLSITCAALIAYIVFIFTENKRIAEWLKEQGL